MEFRGRRKIAPFAFITRSVMNTPPPHRWPITVADFPPEIYPAALRGPNKTARGDLVILSEAKDLVENLGDSSLRSAVTCRGNLAE
jgi:hypothetical protein